VELQEEEAYPVVEVHPFLEAFLVGEEDLPYQEEDLASSVEAPWVSGHREVAFLALPSAEAVQEEVAFLAWSLEHPEVLHIEQEDPLDLLEVLPWAAFLEEVHQEEELAWVEEHTDLEVDQEGAPQELDLKVECRSRALQKPGEREVY
jgi:hypothetical protein